MKTLANEINALKQARDQIKVSFKLTQTDYDLLFLELGCQALEAHIDDKELVKAIKADRQYWMWWKTQYLIHDKTIYLKRNYKEQKQRWINTPLFASKLMQSF